MEFKLNEEEIKEALYNEFVRKLRGTGSNLYFDKNSITLFADSNIKGEAFNFTAYLTTN